MIINIKKLNKILIKYQITPNQFYVLYLVYRKDWSSLHEYVNQVVRKLEQEGRKFSGFSLEDELEPLVEKGYLEHWGKHFETLDLMVTPNFTELLFIDSEDAGDELFKTYPQWLSINGSKIVAKSCDMDLYKKRYADKISNDLILHNKIIVALKRAKDQNLINFKIANFIDGELWTALFENEEDEGTGRFKSI